MDQENERGIPPVETWTGLELNELYEIQTRVIDLYYKIADVGGRDNPLTSQYQRFVDKIDNLILSKESQLFGS